MQLTGPCGNPIGNLVQSSRSNHPSHLAAKSYCTFNEATISDSARLKSCRRLCFFPFTTLSCGEILTVSWNYKTKLILFRNSNIKLQIFKALLRLKKKKKWSPLSCERSLFVCYKASWLPVNVSLLLCNDWVISVYRCDRKTDPWFFTHWVSLKTSLVCSRKSFLQENGKSLLLRKSAVLCPPALTVCCYGFVASHSYATLCFHVSS